MNIALRNEAGALPVRLWYHQHNRWRLWTTVSERRNLLTTVDNTGSETIVVLGRLTTDMIFWRQVEQEAILIFEHIFYLKPDYLYRGIWERMWMQQQNQQCKLFYTLYTVSQKNMTTFSTISWTIIVRLQQFLAHLLQRV